MFARLLSIPFALQVVALSFIFRDFSSYPHILEGAFARLKRCFAFNLLTLKLKSFGYIFIVLFSTVLVNPVFANANSKTARINIENWKTKKGISVFFVARPQIPMLSISTVFDAGSARDGNQYGLANLTNEMLNQGTKQLTVDQIASGFEDIGAQFAATIDRDTAAVSLTSLIDEKILKNALNLYVQVMTQANFPEQAFTREQQNIMLTIAQQEQKPEDVANKLFYKHLYGSHPYAHAPIGTIDSVKTITLKDINSFYQTYYNSSNAIIAIVGAIDKNQAEQIAEQISDQLPAGKKAAPLALASAAEELKNTKAIDFPSTQTHILLGQIGINRASPEYFSLNVGNYILGGNQLTSRLFEEVRNKNGLSYYVFSGFIPLAANGPFAVALQTNNKNADQALQITQSVLKNFIAHGPSEAELNNAKKAITGGFPLKIASNCSILGYLNVIGFYHLPLNYLDTYNDKINAISLADIKKAFANHININKFLTVEVGQNVNATKA